jgi:hypothetical protein
MVAVAGMMLYTPLILADGDESDGEVLNDKSSTLVNGTAFKDCAGRRWLKARLVWRFLKNAELAELEGTVVTSFQNMLIMNTEEGQVRIHLPPTWLVEDETMSKAELIERYLSPSESIIINALKTTIVNNEGLSIYLLFGVEITNELEVNAQAVLPFNIET